MLMTNIAYQELMADELLSGSDKNLFRGELISFVSKEFPKDIETRVWRMRVIAPITSTQQTAAPELNGRPEQPST